MYKQLLLASSLSLGLLFAPGAMAKSDHGSSRHDGRGHSVERHDHRGHARDNDKHRHGNDRRNDRGNSSWAHARERHWQGPRHRVSRYHQPHGYQRHYWRAGERLPSGYRGSRYVVHDDRAYHLHSPPRHHHWVRVDNDVVLTAVATGVVAAVVYGIFQ